MREEYKIPVELFPAIAAASHRMIESLEEELKEANAIIQELQHTEDLGLCKFPECKGKIIRSSYLKRRICIECLKEGRHMFMSEQKDKKNPVIIRFLITIAVVLLTSIGLITLIEVYVAPLVKEIVIAFT